MAALFPVGKLKIISGCSHSTHLENPGEWVESIIEF